MTTKEQIEKMEDIIYRFSNVATGAVEYVGAANYADREREALARVERARIMALRRLKELICTATTKQ